MKDKTELKPIPGYESLYLVDQYGNVENRKTGNPVKAKIDKGYHRVRLFKNNVCKTHTVSRLVASVFLDDYSDEMLVDHINMDTLNNHYSNLRMVTKSQNAANRNPNNGSTSRYKGVSRLGSKYISQITVNGVNHILGRFENEDEAAEAYDIKAVECFGEYARTNEAMGLYIRQEAKQ